MDNSSFNSNPILSYLGLPETYSPSPGGQPIQFLAKHLHIIPPHLLTLFSSITTPKQRTEIPAIRNRRLKYVESNPPELSFSSARSTWPTLWQGREPPRNEPGKEEQEWAEKEFLTGTQKHLGKLGNLLGGYEEEREAERLRVLRRQQVGLEASLPEEDEDTDDEEEEEQVNAIEEDAPEVSQAMFLRRIKERFIYGLLESIDYDTADWGERWDVENFRDEEERWFDDDEEEESVVLDNPTL